MKTKAAVVLMPFLAFLAACGDDPAPAAAEGGAEGEVLEGTISDAMVPLDTIQSEGPRTGGDDAETADDDAAAATDPDEEAAE